MKDALELLIYSLDNELSEAEQEQLKEALKASPELRAERDQYLEMRKTIATFDVPPHPGFTGQVMQKWSARKKRVRFEAQVIRLFPRVAAAAVLLFFATWLTLYVGGDELVMNSLVGVEEISPDEAYSLLSGF